MGVIDAHNLRLRSGGVGERSQNIEDSTNAQLFAKPADAFHGRVKGWSQHKSDSNLLDHSLNHGGFWADVQTQFGENIGASAL